VTVLVVDDNPDHRILIGRRLTDLGYIVRHASSGETALNDLDGVDLVLLDYRLPGLSGVETLRAIADTSGPSVVMVTGMGSEEVAVEAMRAGAIDYLVKDPGYLNTLPQVVERAWRHHDLARRAGELQNVALLVTSGAERGETFSVIVGGARTLLGADACLLHVADATGVALEAQAGHTSVPEATLTEQAARALRQPGSRGESDAGQLVLSIPTPDGEPVGVLTVLAESARAFAPEELRLARTFASFAGIALANLRRLELERELVVELQRMLDLRREFVAHVSHELRTPLTCVQGFAQTLLSHWGQIDDEDRAGFVAKIHAHSLELGDLVAHLLDLSTVEAGRLEPVLETIDLRSEIASVVESLAPILGDRHVDISGSSPAVTGDPGLVRRVLTNLLANAVKYSDPGGPVGVSMEAGAGEAIVSVLDQGQGLTEDERARVFEPFWRSSAVSRTAVRGTGIGLTLVREYVRVMGGRVGVESEPGSGSRFWFSLPASPARSESASGK
jgi:signal transduction histidine kinase